jgi:hypothetical protein
VPAGSSQEKALGKIILGSRELIRGGSASLLNCGTQSWSGCGENHFAPHSTVTPIQPQNAVAKFLEWRFFQKFAE